MQGAQGPNGPFVSLAQPTKRSTTALTSLQQQKSPRLSNPPLPRPPPPPSSLASPSRRLGRKRVPRRRRALPSCREVVWVRLPASMAEEGTMQELPYVKETVLKKRKQNEDWAVKNRERKAAKRQRRFNERKGTIKRPEEFVMEFRNKERDFLGMRTRLKVRKQPKAEALSSKLIFAMRIPGTVDLHPHIKKVLRSLRLTGVLTGVFLKATDLTLKRLLVVEPFVTYGFPNLKNVKELIYKKGRGFLDKEPVPLTSNDIIEKALGSHGIICLEDLVHEIATVGPHFTEASRFLMPLKLKCPERRLQMKKKPYKDGGDSGDRGDKINELIEKLN